MSNIREHIPTLSDEAMQYITNVADKWPTSSTGFPRPPQGTFVDDSVASEVNTFVRRANMHLAQLFQEAEDASPGSFLVDMSSYDRPHEQQALRTYIRTRMWGKTVNASAFPHRVNDLIKVNNVIVGLKSIISKYEAEEEPVAAAGPLSTLPAILRALRDATGVSGEQGQWISARIDELQDALEKEEV